MPGRIALTAEQEATLRRMVAEAASWPDIAAAVGRGSVTWTIRAAASLGLEKQHAAVLDAEAEAARDAVVVRMRAEGADWPAIAAAIERSVYSAKYRAQRLGVYAPKRRQQVPAGRPAGEAAAEDGVPPRGPVAASTGSPAAVPGMAGADANGSSHRLGVSSLRLPGAVAPGDFSGALVAWPGADAPLRDWFRPVSATLQPMGAYGLDRRGNGVATIARKLNRQGERA